MYVTEPWIGLGAMPWVRAEGGPSRFVGTVILPGMGMMSRTYEVTVSGDAISMRPLSYLRWESAGDEPGNRLDLCTYTGTIRPGVVDAEMGGTFSCPSGRTGTWSGETDC
jgi:hypothetical protein